MSQAPTNGQVLPFAATRPPAQGLSGLQVPMEGLLPPAVPERSQERRQALDAVCDAVSAAMSGDVALCRLRQQQARSLCADRPHAAWAARQEIMRMLQVDIVARHLRGCDKRRRLQREIEQLATALRQLAAPEAA